ncbi:histidine phosphatase family protein [Jeotgalibacillus soli]|uniref:Phosphoglycerate mutase n=1 Tax=Jeotgalibacillus soli TaxID=889306 RepID=A0A0C2RHR4_9BACL|nr:histidine phosphatase family protein [Jeotgalibacillus soli]KIL49720.1 hypothetical protein KP78_11880 [Jeotgalibacillus soli]
MELDRRVVLSLYRHGVTQANQEKRYIGWTDALLAADGEKVLQQTKKYRPEAQRVYVSDLTRCVASADILFPNQKKIYHKGLREIHFGEWEGRKADELMNRTDFSKWLNDPTNMEPENGESFLVFTERLNEWLQTIREECLRDHISNMAIVSHGGPIRQLLVQLAPTPQSFWDWKPLHGQGVTLVWSDREAFGRGERCTLLSAVPIMEKENG